MMHPAKRLTIALIALAVTLLPQELLACAVCAGDKNSQMGKAADAGVLTLLLIIMAVLAGIAVFFIYIVRRTARLEQQSGQNIISSSSPKLVLTND
jgi:heme/copper-type cytochrome/quinol oxidase subunit 2